MNDFHPYYIIAFVFMRFLLPFRYLGLFGTPEYPRYYEKGDIVSADLYVVWPFQARKNVTFYCDVSVYFENNMMNIHAIEPNEEYLVHVKGKGIDHIRLYGAPTNFITRGGGGDKDKRKNVEMEPI